MNDSPTPHPLRLTQAEGQPVSMDPSLPNAGLPEQMKGETAAQMASLVIAHLGNVFGGLHYGVEVELKGGDDAIKAHPRLKETLALAAEARVKGTIQEALATLPEECDVNLIGLTVGKALAEDFLVRVDPVLNAQEQDDKGESDADPLADIQPPAGGFAPLPTDPSQVDPDPAPDTTL
jgi:hypothetical protein